MLYWSIMTVLVVLRSLVCAILGYHWPILVYHDCVGGGLDQQQQ